ncbi:SDR family NAD(P)-dependent oxidoreductase [Streptomyces shenzhenensis]|uniref:SDR family NAD(P)-dependent oxidoreductase n=1 Tax=Streptomyces shenzhenensis TaxID=943815 RepID=UPI0036839ED0
MTATSHCLDLSGRTALITGCGRPPGIGATTARTFVAAGGNVVVTDIAAAEPALQQLVADLGEGRAAYALCDVTSAAECQSAVNVAQERFGGLDVLVNNAGSPQGKDRGDLAEVDLGTCERVVDINLMGTVRMTRAALPLLRESAHGRIINLASLAGIRSLGGRAVYSGSKAGIQGLSVALAGELSEDRITVNALLPGVMDTGRNVVNPGAEGAATELVKASSPLGRPGTADDVAKAALFFASDLAEFITGQSLVIDGGISSGVAVW